MISIFTTLTFVRSGCSSNVEGVLPSTNKEIGSSNQYSFLFLDQTKLVYCYDGSFLTIITMLFGLVPRPNDQGHTGGQSQAGA